MTTEAMRAQFEAWLIDEHGYAPDDLIWQEARNCYAEYGIHLAWNAYQAAVSAQPTQVAEVDEPPRVTVVIEGIGRCTLTAHDGAVTIPRDTIINAARTLSAQPAERQGEAVAWQTLGENGQWFNISAAEYWTLKNAGVGQQRPLYLHPAAPVGVPEEVAKVAEHIALAVGYIEKQWPDAKQLDRGPILRNMRRWRDRLLAAAPSAPQGVE